MITIDQLLESVDLDFEPRWVTKDQNGTVWLWEKKPHAVENWWDNTLSIKDIGGKIKLAEFDGKDWTECIYEVPQTTGKIELLKVGDTDMQLSSSAMFRNQFVADTIMQKINELVDAVNELKGV
jgi:coenzyme F420-reducing hydrogenase alpha subunit